MRRKINLGVSEKDGKELVGLANKIFEGELKELRDDCQYFTLSSKEGRNPMFDQLIWWINDKYDLHSKKFYKVVELEEVPTGDPPNPYLKKRKTGTLYCHVRNIEIELDINRDQEYKFTIRRVFVHYRGSLIKFYEDPLHLNEDYMLLSYGEDHCFGQVFQSKNVNGTNDRNTEVSEISKEDFMDAFNKLIFNIKFEALNEDDEDKTGNPYRCESK